MEAMLEIIVADGFEHALWSDDRESVEDLLREAGETTELGEYLSHFADRERINLSDITEEISGGDGELSKTEALLIMMKEF